MNTLRCKQLAKSFGGVRALDGVDLTFEPGELTAIIGPNGAGKTTLINVATGFLRADEGRCLYGNEVISGLSPERVVATGVVRTFQGIRLVSRDTALENVLLARPEQRGERASWAVLRRSRVRNEELRHRKVATRFLDAVGLGDVVHRLASELSIGQQKLLSLACCLATEANVFLLDEPVSGVAPALVVKILDLLQRIADEGRTVVFVEHDLAAVRRTARRVVVMDEGRVLADGPTAAVLEMPEVLEAYVA